MDSNENFKPNIEDLEDEKDINGLIKALEHEDPIIRKLAAVSLKKVGDETAVEALIEALKYEIWKNKYTVLIAVRENAAEALGRIGDKRAVKPLIKALFEDIDGEVRWKAAAALGK